MQNAQGTFFDGQTSVPHQAELTLEADNGEIILHCPEAVYRWPLRDITFHQVGNHIEIQNKAFPQQHVRVADKEFIVRLKEVLKTHDQLGLYQRLLDIGFKLHIAIAGFILGVIALVYLFVLPAIAERATVLIPESYDTYVGNTFWDTYGVTVQIDSAKTEALNKFAHQMNLRNSRPLHFSVVTSETVNAFALPNGNIVVYTGILDQMKDYEELAGLMGHEVAHVNNRHSMKMMCRNLSGYLFLSAVLSDVNGIMAVIGDNINSLRSLTYSRSFEKQADLDGISILAANQIKPNGMVRLFEHIQKKSNITMPEFISSHPMTENRIAYIQKAIRENPVSQTQHAEMERLFKEMK